MEVCNDKTEKTDSCIVSIGSFAAEFCCMQEK